MTRMTVIATTNRTIGRLATRMSTIAWPKITISAIAPTVSRNSSGTTVKTTFPGSVSLFQLRPMTVIDELPCGPWDESRPRRPGAAERA